MLNFLNGFLDVEAVRLADSGQTGLMTQAGRYCDRGEWDTALIFVASD
jgi:hypothetical protein